MEPTSILPCDLGNSSSHSNNSQHSNENVSFRQVLRHWCCHGLHNITSSTLFHRWFAQNVHPLVTPKRIFCFYLSQISFFLAYGFFTQTELYKSYIYNADDDHHHTVLHQARPLLFLAAAFGIHTLCLTSLLFFSFCSVALERYRYHYILKSIGEYVVKVLVVFMVMGIGDEHNAVIVQVGHYAAPTLAPTNYHSDSDSEVINYSKVAGLATWCLLTVDALSIINLLEPGHHCALLEATVTLTLHLGLATGNYVRIPAAAFVLLIVLIKNFLWRRVDHPQAPTNELSPLAWVAPEVV